MNTDYFLLFYEFFKTGLLTFGGGYASLPFLYQMVEKYTWFSHDELLNLIAVSGITPGPIGLNMATFAGFKTLGVQGAVISSIALILPMFIITGLTFKLYRKFEENRFQKSIMRFLRPASCALIAGVGIRLFYNLVMKNSFQYKNFDFFAFFIILTLFLLTFKLKKEPIIYMAIAGAIGVIFKFCNIL